MWRYHHRSPYHRGWHRHGNPLFLILPILFLIVFGGFILKVVLWILPFVFIAWVINKMVRAHHGGGSYYDGEKPKNDLTDDDKPKRRYVETSDGQWVEII
jgi:hypothetical protein